MPFNDVRAVPISAVSVEAGFEEVFADADPASSFIEAIQRLKRQNEIWDFLQTLNLRQLIARVMPDWEASGRVADAQPPLMIGGAALYFACAKKEAVAQGIGAPRVTMQDRTFWVNKHMPSEGTPIAFGSPEYVTEFGKIMLSTAADSVSALELTDTEFCTKILEMPPELGYDNDSRHDLMLGAADVRSLLDAHYERRALRHLVS